MKLASSPFVLRKSFAILTIVFLGFMFALALAPSAKAASFDSTCTNVLTTGTVTCTVPTISTGDIVVVLYQGIAPAACPAFTNGMTTDSQSALRFVLANSACNQVTTKFDAAIYYSSYTNAATLTNDVITVNTGQTPSDDVVEIYAVTGITATGVTNSADAGTTSSASATDLSVTVPSFTINSGITFWSGTGWSIGVAAGSWSAIPTSMTVTQTGTGTGQCNLNFAAAGNQLRGAACGGYGTGGLASNLLANIHTAGTGVAGTAVGISFSAFSSSSVTQVQTIGSCPPGGGTGVGHYALTNSTQFWYSGNALGSEVVNTIQTEVASIKGSGSHTLQLMIYATSAAQTPSAQNAAFLLFAKSFTITSGTTNSTVSVQVNIPLNAPGNPNLPFNFWAVAIVGDDHILVSGSNLGGMTTQSGNPSGSAQPTSFTSQGSATGNKLALCAQGNYQSVLSFTTTTTQAASTSSTVLITVTQTTLNLQAATQDSTTFTIMLLVILLPAMVMMGTTAVATHNGVATTVAFVGGLGIGAALGFQAGLVPFSIVAILVLVMIFMIMGVFMLSRSGGGG